MKLTLVRNATLLLETSARSAPRRPDAARGRHDTADREHAEPVAEPARRAAVPGRRSRRRRRRCASSPTSTATTSTMPRDSPLDLPILTQPESADELRSRGFTQRDDDHADDSSMTRGQPRDRRDRRGARAGVRLGRRRRLHRRRHDLVRRGRTRHASATSPRATIVNGGGARFHEGDPIVMTRARRSRDSTARSSSCTSRRSTTASSRASAYRRRDRAARRRSARAVARRSTARTTSASASASSSGREVRVRDGDDAHARRLRRADAVVRVLDRRRTGRVDAEPARRLEVDVRRRLAARDLLRRDRRARTSSASPATRSTTSISSGFDDDAIASGTARRSARTASTAPGDQRRRLAVPREHALRRSPR